MGGYKNTAIVKVALLGIGVIGWGGVALGAVLAAEGFATTGLAYGDWYWLSRGSQARWEFASIPVTSDPYLALEAFLCLPITAGPPATEIEVRFQVTTSSKPAPRLYVARLWRTEVNGSQAMYFGQLFLSRRELGVGSFLCVKLDGSQAEIPLGVHASSVRVAVGPGRSAGPVLASAPALGQGGGWEEVAAAVGKTSPSPQSVRTLPVSESAEAAPFIAPGTYQGSLGWAGPYTAPISRGTYKVHLRPGEIVTVRIETSSSCILCLVDPSGRKVGEVEGSSWLGLEYRAQVGGAWQILIFCPYGGPRFSYSLTLGIR